MRRRQGRIALQALVGRARKADDFERTADRGDNDTGAFARTARSFPHRRCRSPARPLAALLAEVLIIVLAMIVARVNFGQSVSLAQLGYFGLYPLLLAGMGIPPLTFLLSFLFTGSLDDDGRR
jgi:hypothetical protein